MIITLIRKWLFQKEINYQTGENFSDNRPALSNLRYSLQSESTISFDIII